MSESCLLYYITDRSVFPGDEPNRRRCLREKIFEAVQSGVDYVQLREKDLTSRELESLAREAVGLIDQLRSENRELRTALLINSRTDVALAVGADGVHLRSDDVSPREVRRIWSRSNVGTAALGCPAARSAATDFSSPHPMIGVSCHSQAEVAQAAAAGATFAVFAPVFEKKDAPDTKPAGLELLHQACREKIPVLALGGITLANTRSCLEAGAAGIAAIRLFQENRIADVVHRLRQ